MLYTVEKKFAAHLEETVKKYLIFIDTCSLMNENADQFWGNIIPLLLRENKQIIVPLQVCRTRRSGSIFSDIPYQMPREEKPQTDEPIKSDRSSFLSALEKWFRM